MALYSLHCADVPLRNCSLAHSGPRVKPTLHTNSVFSTIHSFGRGLHTYCSA